MKYVINGKFLARNINGQCRVAIEIVKELDKIVEKDEFVIVAPKNSNAIYGLKNIPIIYYGKTKGNGHIWEQTYFYFFLIRSKCKCLNFLNSHPLFRPDYAYIHDAVLFAYPRLYSSVRGRLQRIYNIILMKETGKKAIKIFTVSYFSKKEIEKYIKCDGQSIHVIYNGWQHMNRIVPDYSIFDKIKTIERGDYYLAASGISPQKNFNWIINNAKINPHCKYVIVGEKVGSTVDKIENTNNIFFTGYLEDGEMKALMKECKAFIHPAVYEGFGMTPLEAIGSGCKKIVLARTASLPEIYREYPYYVEPDCFDIDLDKYLDDIRPNIDRLLEKYSWSEAAYIIKEEING